MELKSKMKNENRIEKVICENNFINFYTNITKSVKSTPQSKSAPEVETLQPIELRMEIVKPTLDEEVFALYKKYQDVVYHEEENTKHFMDFLGTDYLYEPGENEGLFWIKWYFGDKLFAVSVLDVYPTVVVRSNHLLHL